MVLFDPPGQVTAWEEYTPVHWAQFVPNHAGDMPKK